MKKIIILCLIILTVRIYSQNILTVITAKNVQVKKNNSWINLTVGTNLNITDLIKSNINGSASFLYTGGKIINFNSINETKVNSLIKIIQISDNNLGGELLDLMNKKLKPSLKVAANIGGVRATEMIKEVFVITPRKGTKILGSLPIFIWSKQGNEKDYQMIISSNEQDLPIVYQKTIRDTVYKYLSSDPILEKGKSYVFMIKLSKAKKINEFQEFNIASDSEIVNYNKKLDLTKEMIKESDELTKYVLLAMTYENLELYTEAYFSYLEIMKLAPIEKTYKKMFFDYLVSVNLSKQATQISGFNPN
jgi:hypothetical protein